MREETKKLKDFISNSTDKSHLKGSLDNLCREIEKARSVFDYLDLRWTNIRDEYPNEYMITSFLQDEFEDYKHNSRYFASSLVEAQSNLKKVKQKLNQWTKLLQNRHV